MSTKLPRLSVTFPVSLFETIKKDALIGCRSDSSQVIWILTQYYLEKRKEAELFTPPPLREAGRSHDVPVYETPSDQLSLERVSKLRETLGQE